MPTTSIIAPILSITSCTVQRGERTLISGLSFNVYSGECIWVTGANGIGKSSLLRLCAGLLRPQSGDIAWSENNSISNPTKCVSYQPHNDATWPLLKVSEVLSFWGKLAKRSDYVLETIEKLNLTDLVSQPCRTLSAGQSRRVAIAKLLIENRPLWLMDEPTAPLDQTNRAIVKAVMSEHLKSGGSIIVASHTAPEKMGEHDKVLALTETVSA